jgi:integrase
MAIGWAERQKATGAKLELTWFANRSTWKKKYDDVVFYFKHPDSKAGYEAALQEWFLKKSELSGTRKNADVIQHYMKLFRAVQKWYDQFGTPVAEAAVVEQVAAFLAWLDLLYLDTELPDRLPVGTFSRPDDLRPEFYRNFIEQGTGYTSFGSIKYELPGKWIDRLDRMSGGVNSKEPQTISHWLEKYITRVQKRGGRFIKERSAEDRRHKLKHFTAFADCLAHIQTIDELYVENYHAELDEYVSTRTHLELSKDSKIDYFAVFRMFVRWCSQQSACELKAPANLDSKEFGFREPLGTGRIRQEKKLKLWTVHEFLRAVDILPKPYPAYLMLMLNCGFRHIDISELRWTDLRLEERRIVIQRNKLNQQASAPVISYPLFEKTVKLIKESMSTDPIFVFANNRGGRVETAIKLWWKRNSIDYDLEGKRLDYVRKTGSTLISKFDHNLDDMYLGETLSTTAKIHYSFRDGESCQRLDDGIAQLGAEFGFCESPVKHVALTREVLAMLERAGVDLSKLG